MNLIAFLIIVSNLSSRLSVIFVSSVPGTAPDT